MAVFDDDEIIRYKRGVASLQKEKKLQILAAETRKKLRLLSIEKRFEAEELAALQDFENKKSLVFDKFKEGIEKKIYRLELKMQDYREKKMRKVQLKTPSSVSPFEASPVREKPVKGPFIVYMLNNEEIEEDLKVIRKGIRQRERSPLPSIDKSHIAPQHYSKSHYLENNIIPEYLFEKISNIMYEETEPQPTNTEVEELPMRSEYSILGFKGAQFQIVDRSFSGDLKPTADEALSLSCFVGPDSSKKMANDVPIAQSVDLNRYMTLPVHRYVMPETPVMTEEKCISEPVVQASNSESIQNSESVIQRSDLHDQCYLESETPELIEEECFFEPIAQTVECYSSLSRSEFIFYEDSKSPGFQTTEILDLRSRNEPSSATLLPLNSESETVELVSISECDDLEDLVCETDNSHPSVSDEDCGLNIADVGMDVPPKPSQHLGFTLSVDAGGEKLLSYNGIPPRASNNNNI